MPTAESQASPQVLPNSSLLVLPVLRAFEDFFTSPCFTCALGEFMAKHVPLLQFTDGDQPLSNYDVFTKYKDLVEQHLTTFLDEQGVSQEAVCKACLAAKEAGQSAALASVDYMLASTEYEDFMLLAYDHHQLSQWQPDPGAVDDWQLPAAEDEGERGDCAAAGVVE